MRATESKHYIMNMIGGEKKDVRVCCVMSLRKRNSCQQLKQTDEIAFFHWNQQPEMTTGHFSNGNLSAQTKMNIHSATKVTGKQNPKMTIAAEL